MVSERWQKGKKREPRRLGIKGCDGLRDCGQQSIGWKKKRGENLIRGYRKRYGVDWLCAIKELKILGVELDPVYVGRLKQSVKGQIQAKQKCKQESITCRSAIRCSTDRQH